MLACAAQGSCWSVYLPVSWLLVQSFLTRALSFIVVIAIREIFPAFLLSSFFSLLNRRGKRENCFSLLLIKSTTCHGSQVFYHEF